MLQEKILTTLRQSNLDQRKISRIAGVNESSFSRFLNGYEVLLFGSVLRIVKQLFPDEEKELMAEYVVTQKSRNARFAMEYCSLNDLPEQLEQLVNKLSASYNPLDKEWSTLYRLMIHRKKRTFPPDELLSQVEIFAPKEIEMKIMKEILKGYIYYEMRDYGNLELYINPLEKLVEQVKSKYMRDCLRIRIGLLLNYVNLLNNEIEKSRHHSYLVINQDHFERLKAPAYHHLGHSYLYEDYEKANEYLQKAIELFTKLNQPTSVDKSLYTLSFIQSYWGIEREFPFELKGYQEESEYIYYLIQKGEKERAQEMLEQIDLSTVSDWNKGFHYYYQGLINQRKDTLYQSVKCFQLSNDLFHIKLPLQELLKLGEDKAVIEVWSKKDR